MGGLDIVASRLASLTIPLRRQPIQIAREQGRLPQIGRADELHQESFRADGEAAMRRHPKPKRLQVTLEWFQVGDAPRLERLHVILVLVQPLPARHQLGSSKD